MIGAMARDHAIVEDHATFGQHEPIADGTGFERLDRVVVNEIDEFFGIRADDVDLT